jgi:uncharacterized RDD family membrane protein YckC
MSAWLYEGVLAFGIVVAAGAVALLTTSQLPHELGRPVTQAILFVTLGVYFGWCWSRGQTLAMNTWRIRIADRSGRPPGQARALLRYVLCWIWFAPPLALAALAPAPAVQIAAAAVLWIAIWALASRLHPQRQFWHDAWAGTRLIDMR